MLMIELYIVMELLTRKCILAFFARRSAFEIVSVGTNENVPYNGQWT